MREPTTVSSQNIANLLILSSLSRTRARSPFPLFFLPAPSSLCTPFLHLAPVPPPFPLSGSWARHSPLCKPASAVLSHAHSFRRAFLNNLKSSSRGEPSLGGVLRTRFWVFFLGEGLSFLSSAMAWAFPKASSSVCISSSSMNHNSNSSPHTSSKASAVATFRKTDRPVRSMPADHQTTSHWKLIPPQASIGPSLETALGFPARQNRGVNCELHGRLVQAEASPSESPQQSTATVPDSSEGFLVPGVVESIAGLTIDEPDSQPVQIAEKLQTIKEENERLRSQASHENSVSRIIPPPGDGQHIYEIDPYLKGYRDHLEYRFKQYKKKRELVDEYEGGLEAFSRGYEKMGFNRSADGITYREWAPGAKFASLIGDFNNWNPNADVMKKNEFGVWEIFLPNNVDGSPAIPHGSRVKIHMDTPSGFKDSIPAWIKFAVQAPGEIPYNGIYYDPPPEEKYEFKHPRPKKPSSLRIYEAHVGMSSPEPKINSYTSFRDDVLPRIKKLGYNAVQLMAIQEHAYYASFGYHVTNFFAVSSRCGTPDDLKSLIDKAHELGLVVLMDLVHSHASNNVLDGLNMFDGTDSQYFHSGERGYHWMWDSRLFNYGEWEVLRFLLSNARWWIEEYKFDGFRFDGVTSMMYTHHGLQVAFTGNYSEYFGLATDVDAVNFLMLANDMLHALYPNAITVGEDVSGMPVFSIPVADGGVGFDYRLHMAVPDKWIELLSKKKDEDWQMGDIVYTLTNRRWKEKCVTYAESHDQALVGDKTIAFWLMDKDMYDFMAVDGPTTPTIDRGIALHKMIRLITMGLGGEGYLNFMGNEFGHPEWIDFPRGDQRLPNGKFVPGNNNSFDKCRRRFDLGDANYLRYHCLQEFDCAMHQLEEQYGFMVSEHQYVSRKDEGDKVIVFERGNLVFVFNFHWQKSFPDYRIGCIKPGRYKVVLNSDEKKFGGYDRLDPKAQYFTSEGWYDDRPYSFMVYTPCRTAVVYALDEEAST